MKAAIIICMACAVALAIVSLALDSWLMLATNLVLLATNACTFLTQLTLEGRKPPRHTLTCMRLDEMARVHPQQIEGVCSSCSAKVGIYPSGQAVLQAYPGEVDVMCNQCGPVGPPAPGALNEVHQSRWRQ